MWFYALLLSGATVSPVFGQNCGPIQVNTNVPSGAEATISSATSAVAPTAATATVSGGPNFADYVSVTVPVATTARLVSAISAAVTVEPSASLLVDQQTGVMFTVRPSATLDMKTATMGIIQASGTASATGDGIFVEAYTTGAMAIGDASGANVNAADGGVGIMYGVSGFASFGAGGTMTMSGSSGTCYCAGDATAAVFGSNNELELAERCTASLSDFNFVTSMASGARATLANQARAIVASGAAVYVRDGEATVMNDGAATMEPGATVSAQSNVRPTPARPNVRVFDVTDDGDYTVYFADEMGSNGDVEPKSRCPLHDVRPDIQSVPD